MGRSRRHYNYIQLVACQNHTHPQTLKPSCPDIDAPTFLISTTPPMDKGHSKMTFWRNSLLSSPEIFFIHKLLFSWRKIYVKFFFFFFNDNLKHNYTFGVSALWLQVEKCSFFPWCDQHHLPSYLLKDFIPFIIVTCQYSKAFFFSDLFL